MSGVAEDGEGGQGSAAHRVDVAEGVGGGDSAEGGGVVDDGSEEVGGLHEGTLRRELEDAGIVGGIKPDQKVGVLEPGNARQNAVQNLWTQLGRSTRGFYVSGELLHRHRTVLSV